MDPIRNWKVEEKKNLASHPNTCPYNVRSRHDGWCEKHEKWDSVLNELTINLKQKQIPSMWSESLLEI